MKKFVRVFVLMTAAACILSLTGCREEKEREKEPEPMRAAKPVIYLYPEEKTDVTVKLEVDGELTCTYPAYDDGWRVTAMPDGTLVDEKGQTYNYLYYEGERRWEETDLFDGVCVLKTADFTEGFCVKGKDTAAFLERALSEQGLTRKEANEFIVYWLPLMEDNEYNIISFQSERYSDMAKLTVTPAPDTVLRVYMAWKAAEKPVGIAPQSFTAPEREGFTVVEWGGSEIK